MLQVFLGTAWNKLRMKVNRKRLFKFTIKSWESQNFLKSTSFLWNSNFHYRVHKIPLHEPVLSQLNTVHNLLTYSMVQSPSWEANWFAASQEIPRISRNPKVHYRTHKRPPTVCILGQPSPVHIPTSHLLEFHPNIIHSSTPRSPQWSPSLRFPHQDPIQHPLLPHTRHMPSPSHSSRFYHPHNIGWGVQINLKCTKVQKSKIVCFIKGHVSVPFLTNTLHYNLPSVLLLQFVV